MLPTLGGQTGLNLAIELDEAGVLEAYNVEMIGASIEAIRTAEDRQRFKTAMTEIGLRVPPSGVAYDGRAKRSRSRPRSATRSSCGPAYILGGGGTGIAHDRSEMQRVAERGLAASPISEILIERSVVGWKEYELEVMRDHADNVVVICSIENVDAMGVHTGESITVAPAQTLTDVEYQRMRDAAFACIRRIGVETGGSNVQFAVDPRTGEQVIIEMNPRVSRSSALASKATGFPIAKIAAKLAVGYRLDEVRNDITRETPASFEPTIDYVVTKIPRWAFEKLPGSVAGARHADAVGRRGDGDRPYVRRVVAEGVALARDRSVRAQLRSGRARARRVTATTSSSPRPRCPRPSASSRSRPRCAASCRSSVCTRQPVSTRGSAIRSSRSSRSATASPSSALAAMTRADWRYAKQHGFSDSQLASSGDVDTRPLCAAARLAENVRVTYKTVDTCAAEFDAHTPYHYGTYEDEDEIAPRHETGGR